MAAANILNLSPLSQIVPLKLSNSTSKYVVSRQLLKWQ